MLRLSPQGSGTHLEWEADIKELGGLLKAVPKGLVLAAAQKVIADACVAMMESAIAYHGIVRPPSRYPSTVLLPLLGT